MRRAPLKVMLAAAAIGLIACASAYALQSEIGKTKVSATATISPRTLPARGGAPVNVTNVTRIGTTDGSQPPTLKQLALLLRQARLARHQGAADLHAGEARRHHAPAGPQALRRRDRRRRGRQGRRSPPRPGAGQRSALPLTFFNAPPQGGMPSLIAHAYETVPAPKTLLVPITVERIQHGRYGYRVKIQLPEIAGGYGAATLAEATIGKTWKRGGKTVGYVERPLRGRAPAGPRHPHLHRRQLLPGHPDLAMPRGRLIKAAALCLRPGAAASPPAPPARRAGRSSTTSSSAPTAASSPARCRASSSRRSTSRATSTSPPKAAASRRRWKGGDRLRPRRPPQRRRPADLPARADRAGQRRRSAARSARGDRRQRRHRSVDRPPRRHRDRHRAADALQRAAPGRQPDGRSSTPAPPFPPPRPSRSSSRSNGGPGPFRYRATLDAAPDRRRPRRHHPRRRQGRPPLQRRRPARAATSPPAAPTASSAPTAASASPTAPSSTAAVEKSCRAR